MNVIHPIRDHVTFIKNWVVKLDYPFYQASVGSSRKPSTSLVLVTVFDIIGAIVFSQARPDRSMLNGSPRFKSEYFLMNFLIVKSIPKLLEKMPVSLVVSPASFSLIDRFTDQFLPFFTIFGPFLLCPLIIAFRPKHKWRPFKRLV